MILNIYAAIGAAAEEQKRLSHAPECTRTNENQTGDIIT